jgi:hypothetical protein
MYQMIQVSFAWQTWWRLPILMVGSGSKEKKTPVCCTLAFLTKISFFQFIQHHEGQGSQKSENA